MTNLIQFPVHLVPPSQLKPYYQNVKAHDKKGVVAIANLITRFGFDQPIVVDSNYVIIKGHGRYMAALFLSLSSVPIIIRDDLTPVQVKATRIADNQLFELGEIDKEGVASELHDFIEAGGVGAGDVFDFLKVTSPKAAGVVVESTVSSAATFEGTMQVCPACNYTYWEGTS